jgi:hypothetical protein
VPWKYGPPLIYYLCNIEYCRKHIIHSKVVILQSGNILNIILKALTFNFKWALAI